MTILIPSVSTHAVLLLHGTYICTIQQEQKEKQIELYLHYNDKQLLVRLHNEGLE